MTHEHRTPAPDLEPSEEITQEPNDDEGIPPATSGWHPEVDEYRISTA